MNYKFNSNQPLILDGGMGQTLIKKGMTPKGTLWSATALLDSSLHQLVINTHHEFINAGAKVITTNNFTVRKLRFSENKILNEFESALHTAGVLAKKAVESQNIEDDIIIAGSVPTRNQTYSPLFELSEKSIFDEFRITGHILNDYVDIFYLDVLSSIKEIEIALEALKYFKKKILIGVHIKKNGLVPDGNNITELNKFSKKYNILGVIVSCTDQTTVLNVIKELQNLKLPYGFKTNAFIEIPEGWKIKPGNPSDSLGINNSFNNKSFIEFAELCRFFGASIFGGCCEVLPNHIKALSDFYRAQ